MYVRILCKIILFYFIYLFIFLPFKLHKIILKTFIEPLYNFDITYFVHILKPR